jgi:hypothetical protein
VLEHLISHSFDPTICETEANDFVGVSPTRGSKRVASPSEIVSAQAKTADWLEEAGLTAAKVAPEAAATAARTAFTALTTVPDSDAQRQALVELKLPEEIRHLVGMLTAYDWEFVHQAKEIRGYVVAQLLEESKNPTASIRLKALGMLGKVTEVGLFTDKIEVKKTDMTDEEIDARIKEKLGKFMGVIDAADVTDVGRAPSEPPQPHQPE